MIEVKNIYFAYKNKRCLSNINLNFEKGKFYGIIGPNGSGKSTLLKIISNNLKAVSGEILINGKNVKDYKGKALAQTLSVMPQSRHKPDMTVFDFAACGRFPYKTFASRLNDGDIKTVSNALAKTGLADFENRNLKSLSGGECQKVFLAQLLAQDTDYILCDEPTTFLDLSAEKEILNLLKKESETKCVVAVLHNLSFALKICDKVAVLDSGTVAEFGTPEIIVKNKTIDKVFNTKCNAVLINGKKEYIFL